MSLIDTHTHYTDERFDLDREAVLSSLPASGVLAGVDCASKEDEWFAVSALAGGFGHVYSALGVHGLEAETAEEGYLDRLRNAIQKDKKCVAVGEIGLDYYYDLSPRPTQRAVLAEQLALAVELDLPVVLHTRESDADLRELLDQAPDGLRGVLHCFLSDRAMATWALERGLYLGFGGAVTFRNTQEVQAIAAEAPLDRLLIETDAPFMAPHPHRGQRNEPAYVSLVAERIAQLRSSDPQAIAQHTFDNAVRLFGLPQHDT